jgi:hypothetical protein
MNALAVTLFQILACLGFGAGLLRLFKAEVEGGLRMALAFAFGMGALGWLAFPLGVHGWLNSTNLAILLTIGCGGLVFLFLPSCPRKRASMAATSLDSRFRGNDITIIEKLLLLGLLIAFGFDLAEALSPPVDADSLAYHFTLPKEFLQAGGLFFVPRAVDGAVPLLVQMTHLPVLSLGGERALTLWTMLSGWAASVLFYFLLRQHVNRAWSLAGALALATLPATIFGAGSGQVEIRLALLAMAAAWAVGRAAQKLDARYAALAGLAAGFLAGGKYTGLLFVAAAGLVIIFNRNWLRMGLVFGATALFAGIQWYAWNAYHTGDPVFPMLFSAFKLADSPIWTAKQAEFFRIYFDSERGMAVNPLTLLFYPFMASLFPPGNIDAGRTGLGPYALLLLPFALAGAWRARARMTASPLFAYFLIAIIFYALWFLTGSSQRVRHLLPVWPLLLAGGIVAAARLAGENLSVKRALALATGLALLLQLAGHAVFARPFLAHLSSGESREAFLARAVPGSEIATDLNARFATRGRVMLTHRQWLYFLDIPYHFAHPLQSGLIDQTPQAKDPVRYLWQVRKLGVTHALAPLPLSDDRFLGPLEAADCLEKVTDYSFRQPVSRTLAGLGEGRTELKLVRFSPDCQLSY